MCLDEKKDADNQLEKEVTPSHFSNVEEETEQGDQDLSKKPQRKRKRKSYGKDFEENDDNEESDDSEQNDSMYCFDSLISYRHHKFAVVSNVKCM